MDKVTLILVFWIDFHHAVAQVSPEDLAALAADPAGHQLVAFKNNTKVKNKSFL